MPELRLYPVWKETFGDNNVENNGQDQRGYGDQQRDGLVSKDELKRAP